MFLVYEMPRASILFRMPRKQSLGPEKCDPLLAWFRLASAITPSWACSAGDGIWGSCSKPAPAASLSQPGRVALWVEGRPERPVPGQCSWQLRLTVITEAPTACEEATWREAVLLKKPLWRMAMSAGLAKRNRGAVSQRSASFAQSSEKCNGM